MVGREKKKKKGKEKEKTESLTKENGYGLNLQISKRDERKWN